MKITKKLQKKLEKIAILLTDVDGVLTDGGMIYTEQGLVMKKFQVKDGMGTVLLREAGIKTGIITTDKTPIARVRGERLQMDFVVIGSFRKDEALAEILAATGLQPENVAFIGDDVNDIPILKMAGVTAAPADAMPVIIDMVDYVCTRRGGKGAYREFADLILQYSRYVRAAQQ